MDKKNRNRMAGWGDYVTSTISVTLVLFILGLVGVINISFDGVSATWKKKMGLRCGALPAQCCPGRIGFHEGRVCKCTIYIHLPLHVG